MINQFRNLNPVNLLLLVLFAFLTRIVIFMRLPDQVHFEFAEAYTRFFLKVPAFSLFSPVGSAILATVLVLGQAIIFNVVVNRHGLLAKQSYLPALMYITACGLFLQFMLISPPLICNFILIWMMDKFIKSGKMASAMMTMFDIGMLTALGTLIYFPFVVFLVLLWLSLLLYRSFNWREWVAGLIGFLTIFFLVAVYYYWNNNLYQFIGIWKPLANAFPSGLRIHYNDYLVLIPVGLIMVLAVLQLRENFFRSFISTRKAFQLLFFMFLITFISFYTKNDFRLYHFLLSVPPGAVMLAYYFSNARKRWFYETLFVLLVFSMQYFLFV